MTKYMASGIVERVRGNAPLFPQRPMARLIGKKRSSQLKESTINEYILRLCCHLCSHLKLMFELERRGYVHSTESTNHMVEVIRLSKEEKQR